MDPICAHELTISQGPKWSSVRGYVCSPRGNLSRSTASREELHDVLDKWFDAWDRCRAGEAQHIEETQRDDDDSN